jgi:hypothetical protein
MVGFDADDGVDEEALCRAGDAVSGRVSTPHFSTTPHVYNRGYSLERPRNLAGAVGDYFLTPCMRFNEAVWGACRTSIVEWMNVKGWRTCTHVGTFTSGEMRRTSAHRTRRPGGPPGWPPVGTAMRVLPL